MSLRLFGAALAVPLFLAAAAPAAADDAKPAVKAALPEEAGLKAPPGWKAPRTEWGDPDLTGRWPIAACRGCSSRPA